MSGYQKPWIWICIAGVLLFSVVACGKVPISQETSAVSPVLIDTVTPAATLTSIPTMTEPALTPTPTNTEQPPLNFCTPLEGFSKTGLMEAVVNPFLPPLRGSDDPHHGIDFAVMGDSDRIARAGFPVKAVLDGKVIGVVQDRFPYGNAVFIETPLERFSPQQLALLSLPAAVQPLETTSALTCPNVSIFSETVSDERSLYILYAHLQSAPDATPGDDVNCGDHLGLVGDTGNALNPHLHLESRVGPSGLSLDSMAHYDPSATEYEMAAYCLWRISGDFELVDPLRLIERLP